MMDNELLVSSNAFEAPKRKKPNYKLLAIVTVLVIAVILLLAAKGQLLFPEIKHLEKHNTFFKN